MVSIKGQICRQGTVHSAYYAILSGSSGLSAILSLTSSCNESNRHARRLISLCIWFMEFMYLFSMNPYSALDWVSSRFRASSSFMRVFWLQGSSAVFRLPSIFENALMRDYALAYSARISLDTVCLAFHTSPSVRVSAHGLRRTACSRLQSACF